MSHNNPRFQTLSSGPERDQNSSVEGTLWPDSAEALARAALHNIFSEINTKNKKRRREIDNLKRLIATLRQHQPLEVGEICSELAISHTTVTKQLNRLIDLDLVVKTRFEHHCLYCINGHFNCFVEEILSHWVE